VGGVATAVGIDSIAFGAAGTFLVGGVAFPPVAAILLGAGAGVMVVGSIFLLIRTLYATHQFKALAYLSEILTTLDKLSKANMEFYSCMNQSIEEASSILSYTDSFKKNLKSGSLRYRTQNAELCLNTIDSTQEMIKCIDCINDIDLSEWIDTKSLKSFSTEEKSTKSITY
jgi:hypothetical protein